MAAALSKVTLKLAFARYAHIAEEKVQKCIAGHSSILTRATRIA